MKYTVKYSELYKQLIGIIVIPIAIVAIYFLFMMLIRFLHPSEIAMNIYVYGGSIFLALSSIYFLRKNILMKADLEYDKYGIRFFLNSKSFLYSEDFISIMYDNVKSITLKEDDEYRVFIKIITITPKKTIFISPNSFKDYDTFIECWEGINEKMKQSN